MWKPNHAIVVGASIGGLLAARALADYFEQVTLVDRDIFPPLGEHRKAIPQGRHVHVLHLQGTEIMERMFPGLVADLVEKGVPLIRKPEVELIWFEGGGYHARFTLDGDRLGVLGVSRPLLEGYLRKRVLALPNVRAVDACDALGLVPSERGGRVCGVRVLRRQEGSAEEVIDAQLVVDAAGRGSRAASWLRELGYAPPVEEKVTINFGYCTRLYRRRPDDVGGAKAVVIPASPALKRSGVMLAQEGDRWIVSLGGFADDYPPSDEGEFVEYARSLPAPEIFDVIRRAEPQSEASVYRFKASIRRRYERLSRFPDGFLVFGDAICSFNPVYGQGMSVAAMEALDLQEALREGTDGLWRRFFRRAGKSIDNPWRIAVSSDLRFPAAEGKRTLGIRFVNAYMERLHSAAHRDPVVARAFSDVAGLVAPPEVLLRPGMASRVLWRNLFGKSPELAHA